jgi:hypothetical protein
MSEKIQEKYDKVQSKIEKTINPFVTVKISMPEGVDKEDFLKLESDAAFIEMLKEQARDWLNRRKIRK